MEEDAIVDLTKEVFGHVESLVEFTPQIRTFLDRANDSRPYLAKGLKIAALICGAVGGNQGILPLTLLGVVFASSASILDPEDQFSALNSQLRAIDERLSVIEGKIDEILEILREMKAKTGMKNIRTHHREMRMREDLKDWAEHFTVTILTEYKADFEKENLKNIFEHCYTNKCEESFDALKEIYEFVLTTRIMYTQLMVTFYQLNGRVNKDKRESYIMEQVEHCISDVKQIKESVNEVCPYFLAVASLPDDCPFSPAYIPEVPINGHVALPEKMPTTPYGIGHYISPLISVTTDLLTHGKGKTFIAVVDKSKIVNQFLKFSWWKNSCLQIGSLASISVTAKVETSETSWLTGTLLKQGPARVEIDEKIQWGTLNKQAKWEGGVIEFDERHETVYRRYEKGVKVKDSFRKFDGFKWSKP